jgi:YidC/Oxa1 family membrane protein insertase
MITAPLPSLHKYCNVLLLIVMILTLCCVSVVAYGTDSRNGSQEKLSPFPGFETVREAHTFYGLASYYNNVDYYLVKNERAEKLDRGQIVSLSAGQWLVGVGRLKALAIRGEGLSIMPGKSEPDLDLSSLANNTQLFFETVAKPELQQLSPELDQLRYAHLWSMFSILAKTAEAVLIFIQSHLVNSWGLTIIAFAVVIKLLLIPVTIMTVGAQRKVSRVQAQLAPHLADIKENYDGEEAHNRVMAAHKSLGVTPFYTLKPMLATMIQVPILIAVFNALGEMPQFSGQSFLWISDLAYPDSISVLPGAIPLLGSSVSLLPVLMTAVTVLATLLHQDRLATAQEVKRQKRNLYLLASAFFILFYPFPAAMVLYWTAVNVLQIFQQRIIKI